MMPETREENPEAKIHDAIEELRGPIEKLLGELREKIDGGEYQLIIGDDASGRIPTLIFDNLLKRVYKEKGYEPPQTLFFAGAQLFKEEEKKVRTSAVSGFLKKGILGKELDGRALIVTDTISSGDALESITVGLKEAGIQFDIVTIALIDLENDKFPEGRLQLKLGGKIYYGNRSINTPGIYGSRGISGVYKESSKDLFARPIVKQKDMEGDRFLTSEGIQKQIGRAREDVKVLSEDLLRWYRTQS